VICVVNVCEAASRTPAELGETATVMLPDEPEPPEFPDPETAVLPLQLNSNTPAKRTAIKATFRKNDPS
jgi:hypothetical protein